MAEGEGEGPRHAGRRDERGDLRGLVQLPPRHAGYLLRRGHAPRRPGSRQIESSFRLTP